MYERQDFYHQKAKREGMRARSSYKLVEIQKKYNLIKKKSSVLDIGCAPGGWLQVIKKYTQGVIVGVDLVKVKPVRGTDIYKADITDENTLSMLKEKYKLFDVVVSDIAPKTSGVRARDQALSYELSRMSFVVALSLLREGGSFVVKTFQSPDTDDLVKEMKPYFGFLKRYVPKSTRQSSKEIYIIASKFKKKKEKS